MSTNLYIILKMVVNYFTKTPNWQSWRVCSLMVFCSKTQLHDKKNYSFLPFKNKVILAFRIPWLCMVKYHKKTPAHVCCQSNYRSLLIGFHPLSINKKIDLFIFLLQLLQNFIVEYFDQNPISQVYKTFCGL